ncbi:uncharacterized protein C8A04DRAFT_24340 [Dichotomopilus funicola]|uniref:Uncharacterized protein n=1 Tax=Dichotomopilus funicola TaxID=1934379 RepID=A0AAN6ZR32_9PEZI|nr:hypothetical protein C8A04DRAFT_24340 [Dichotomopilus funicola]
MEGPDIYLRGGAGPNRDGPYRPPSTYSISSSSSSEELTKLRSKRTTKKQTPTTKRQGHHQAAPSSEYTAAPRNRFKHRESKRLGIQDSPLRPARAKPVRDKPNAGSEWMTWAASAARSSDSRVRELTSGSWRPTRARFDALWPMDGEVPDEWYEKLYSRLFESVRDFAETYFGHDDFPDVDVDGAEAEAEGKENEEGAIWLEAGLSNILLSFIGQIAIQDNNTGGWDALLTQRAQRECLVVGVVGKVLETAVFDDLLFGESEPGKTMLAAQDKSTVNAEGYHRTNLRSQNVRTLLAGETLPSSFWDAVDQLALQITTLMLPLLELVENHLPARKLRSLRRFYQDLHIIVSEAGYLSIGIRWSRNIFRFSQPFPGEVWNNDQEHVDDTVYKASEAAAKKADSAAEQKWKLERAGAKKAVWRRPSRMGKVQVVLWPKLERFATIGKVDPMTGVADGENLTTILKSQVVYYHGLANPEDEGEGGDYSTLDEWVSLAKRGGAVKRWFLVLRWATSISVLWLLLSVLGLYIPAVANFQHAITEEIAKMYRWFITSVWSPVASKSSSWGFGSSIWKWIARQWASLVSLVWGGKKQGPVEAVSSRFGWVTSWF